MSSNKSKFSKNKPAKEEIVKLYGESNKDTGSPRVQIALLSERVTYLTGHIQANKHDKAAKRGLINILGKRRKMAKYYKKTAKDQAEADKFLKKMGISV